MPAKKIRPPPIVPVQLCQVPPEYAERIERLDRCNALPMEMSLRFIGMVLSKNGALDANCPGAMEVAAEQAWDTYLDRFRRMQEKKYAETAAKTAEERAEREAIWAKEKAQREIERAVMMSKADGPAKKLSMKERVEWVWEHIADEHITEGVCPDKQTWTMLEAYRGNDETRRQFFERFVVKYLPSQKDVDMDANKRVGKSTRTLEELDRILGEHVEAES